MHIIHPSNFKFYYNELRLSIYSFVVIYNNKCYIYSTRNGAIIKIPKRVLDCLYKNNYRHGESKDLDQAIESLKNKNIISTQEDEVKFIKKHYMEFLKLNFQNSHLSLTIVPTEACNLKCPYCFEKDKNAISMSDQAIASIIDFIKSHASARTFDVTWFGGEPLLRTDIIKKFLMEFENITIPKFIGHSIITNGTLIDNKAISLFKRFPLNSMQITIDGNKNRHNKLRFKADGTGTYDLILSNTLKFAKENDKTHISVRINIDKNNCTDYLSIYKSINNTLTGIKNINIYPGILKGENVCDQSNTFLTNEELSNFYTTLMNEGLNYHRFPKIQVGGCTATNLTSVVIGADGTFYSCWEDIGNKRHAIGSINNPYSLKSELLTNYLMNGNKFNDHKCLKCGFFPICTGGCPKKRLQCSNEIEKNELCCQYAVNQNTLLKLILSKILTD